MTNATGSNSLGVPTPTQLPGIFTFATLPALPGTPNGSITAFTSDRGLATWTGAGWFTSGSSLVSTLKAAIAAALITNPITVQPLTAPAAWVTGTAYTAGQSITNGGNAYLCLNGGVSGVTGPVGVGNALQTDGSVTWYYYGPTFTSSPLAPVITNVAFAQRYTGLFWTSTLCNYGIGSTRIQDSSNFLYYGSVGTDGAGTNGSYQFNQNALIGGVQFMTDAPAFQIVIPTNVGPSINLFVNDVPITLGCTFQATGNQFIQLVFADRRPRKITFECQTNLIPSFYGVIMNDTISKVWAPQPSPFVMSLVGTSYLDGSGQHPVTASLGIGSQTVKLLGCTNYWVDRLGSGTGYVNNGGGNGVFGSASRLAALAAAPTPDVVLITGGGINDATAVPNPTTAAGLAFEQAAALAYYKAVRAIWPNALMFVVGSEAGNTGPSAAVFNMELAVTNAVTAFNDPNCYYIPQSPTPATKSWISGTGTTAATNNTGNSDVTIGADGIHPVQYGVNYLAVEHANGIRRIVNALS